ncbi:MAG: DegT/DnrJ/EryC1/StrS family aminotransferase [Caldilineaceae bacterium]|nr:DegT/DnrJ/EryC1/StrS family aminotransferase [Caldilineaceae bacterium]
MSVTISAQTVVELPPAIAGGTPAKQTPYGKERRYGEEELAELEAALQQETLFYAQGKKVHQLEADFANKNGVDYAIATSSGTASIHAALIAAEISPGDEVLVSPITDMGSIAPILYQGAVPVFVDLDPRTYTITPAAVEAAITPQTRAILAVHLGGNACDLAGLTALAARHNLVLIEDCAQAFGCTYQGKPIGTIGAMGCFSYNEFKHISSGDGGLVITNDEQLALRLRLATDKAYNRTAQGTERNPTFLANNYRMTELQGAVAVAQLPKLDSIVARRRAWCGALSEQLADLPGLLLPQETPGCDSSWWFYMMRVVPEELGADATEFAAALSAEGLRVSAHYIGQCIYEYPIFTEHSAFARGEHAYMQRQYGKGLCPEAEAILATCVTLAINQAYTDTDLAETVTAVRRVVAWFQQR